MPAASAHGLVLRGPSQLEVSTNSRPSPARHACGRGLRGKPLEDGRVGLGAIEEIEMARAQGVLRWKPVKMVARQ